jgi:hypothetical protein
MVRRAKSLAKKFLCNFFANLNPRKKIKEKFMSKHSNHLLEICALIFMGGGVMSLSAHAQQCCPSGGVGSPKSIIGLGQSSPQIANYSIDPAWRVYQFERQGIRYLQVNDLWGNTRLGIGRIGTTAWVLPMGSYPGRIL